MSSSTTASRMASRRNVWVDTGRRRTTITMRTAINGQFLIAPMAGSRVRLEIYIAGTWTGGTIHYAPYAMSAAGQGIGVQMTTALYHPLIIDRRDWGVTVTAAWYGHGTSVAGSQTVIAVAETFAE